MVSLLKTPLPSLGTKSFRYPNKIFKCGFVSHKKSPKTILLNSFQQQDIILGPKLTTFAASGGETTETITEVEEEIEKILLHEAIMREDSSEFEKSIILQEFQKGFKISDRLLRPSMVKVSAGPGPAQRRRAIRRYRVKVKP